MALTATELLNALAQTGTPQGTIELGQKFVRLMGEDVEGMLKHFQDARITEGTILKARDLLSGRKSVKDFEQPPPQWSHEAKEERIAKILGQEAARVSGEILSRQAERQALAEGSGIGDPAGNRKAVAAMSKK